MASQTITTRKTVIITGGNTGLGYHCAKTIASSNQDWHIIIASRDKIKATAAVKQLISETGNEHIEAMTLDLGFLTSVRAFAQDFATRDTLPPLRAIVCNAGIQIVTGTTHTKDGFETTFGVNHLGHFLLVNLLLKYLVAPARIVFVSSGVHDPDKLEGKIIPPRYRHPEFLARPETDPTALEESPARSGMRRYATSKLCNVLCTYELAHRLQSQGHSTLEHPITVNAFDPGAVPGTELTRQYNPLLRFALSSAFLLRLLGVNANSPSTSGQAMARLVLDPQLQGISAKYFSGLKEIASSQESYDKKKAAELWEVSGKLVNLTAGDSIWAS
ncbi:SDR family NAD(P)-dependent oxidoreductase [Desmonostoc muscorum LEGE 12446]|uniref:SDR family NAD(P)-dependent oxidoreductase n=1 Tax=Desmonostoc muscorum LEGE 12446 TaxID=1828758 RepID=A0A8J6ZHJ6_DESMC|nr:SDR family NAD(P)-dependent oxidoreductase [Desmonostoc muscorum]MCF2144942.1 SDR family NAD(P)-dependent oxidoreductase [Desmonostoc muscorum LEGE 12446]